MQKYLVSGLSGTGKTTIQHELDKLGYETIDSDEKWGYYGDIVTEKPTTPPQPLTREWYKNHGWIWSSQTVQHSLVQPRPGPLFVCGGSRNEAKFYDLFDKVFILHVPDEIMRDRLLARKNWHVSSDLQIQRMLESNQGVYKDARKNGGIVIETTKPLAECIQIILDSANAH